MEVDCTPSAINVILSFAIEREIAPRYCLIWSLNNLLAHHHEAKSRRYATTKITPTIKQRYRAGVRIAV